MRVFTAGPNDAGRRVDAFFIRLLPTAPKSLIYKYMRTGKIKVSGKKPAPADRLLEGDEIKYFGDESFLKEETPRTPAPASSVQVLCEDENIALLVKPVCLASQPDKLHTKDTLVDRFLWYLYQKGEFRPGGEHGFTPALCNRLDFNTQGLVIGAKNLPALRSMNEAIRKGLVRKLYLCRVEGVPSPGEGEITGALLKDTKTNKSQIHKEGKTARTRYRTLHHDGKTSLLEVELFSGRSHQIRVHLASIGCPLIGDAKYGNGGQGQALCAYKIRFDFPPDGGVLDGLSGKTFVLPEGDRLPILQKRSKHNE